MENIRRHLSFGLNKTPSSPQSRSQFHLGLPDTLQLHVEESIHLLASYVEALNRLCNAGTHLADKLNDMLKGSIYTDIAGQFLNLWKDLSDTTSISSTQVIEETEMQLRELHSNLGIGERNNTSPENMKVVGACLASIIQLQSQLFQSAGQALSSIEQCQLLDDFNQKEESEESCSSQNSENSLPCTEKDQRVLECEKSVNDLSMGFREHFASLFTKLTHKASTSRSHFYVNFDKEDTHTSSNNFQEEFQNGEVAVCSLHPDRSSFSGGIDKSVLKTDPIINFDPVLKKGIPASDEFQDILTLLSCGLGKAKTEPDSYTYPCPPFSTNSLSYGQWQSNGSESLAAIYYAGKQNFIHKDILPGAEQSKQLCFNSWGWPHSIQTLNFKSQSSNFAHEQNPKLSERTPLRQIIGPSYNNDCQELNSNWADNQSHRARSKSDNKNWYSGQDSSSSSDEASSNNGHDTENVFSIGLELTGSDLVASVNQRRRHSSSDCLASFDDNQSSSNSIYRKRSYGDLSSDGNKNKTSTWPLKQALAKSISLCTTNQLHFCCDQLQPSFVGCHFGMPSVWSMQESNNLPPSGADNRNLKIENKFRYISKPVQN